MLQIVGPHHLFYLNSELRCAIHTYLDLSDYLTPVTRGRKKFIELFKVTKPVLVIFEVLFQSASLPLITILQNYLSLMTLIRSILLVV